MTTPTPQFPRVTWTVETSTGPAAHDGEAAMHATVNGQTRYSTTIKTELDEDMVPTAELQAAAARLALAESMHDRLVATVDAMHEKFGRLHDFINDCVEGGRISPETLPDDYKAIVNALIDCLLPDQHAKAILAEINGSRKLLPSALATPVLDPKVLVCVENGEVSITADKGVTFFKIDLDELKAIEEDGGDTAHLRIPAHFAHLAEQAGQVNYLEQDESDETDAPTAAPGSM